MARDIPINHDFPDGFHDALARLIVEFGTLEYLTALCIKDMSGKGFDAGLLEALRQGQFGRLHQHALRIAPNSLTDDELATFQDYMATAEELSFYRNDSVHAYWTMENGKIMRVRPRKSVSGDSVDWTRSHSVTVEEIGAKADEIGHLHLNLDRTRLKWDCRAQTD